MKTNAFGFSGLSKGQSRCENGSPPGIEAAFGWRPAMAGRAGLLEKRSSHE